MAAPDQATPSGRANHVMVEAVSLVLEGKTILDGLTLDVTAARIGVVGRNGSGKSTLGLMLAGILAPQAGRVRINGLDVVSNRKAALREVGVLFQNPDHQIIFPTVQEELAFGLVQQGHSKPEAAALVAETLARFGKPHWQDAAIARLSQGQKQLVCIMAIAAMTPKMIILDEPFSGLDIPTKAQLNRYLSRYDGGLLHISHDPADLAGYDQVVWLDQGRVVAIGPADAVLDQYLTRMREISVAADDLSELGGIGHS